MLGHRLRHHRHDAGGGCQDHQEPRPEKTRSWPATKRHHRDPHQQRDQHQPGQHPTQRRLHRRAVIEHQRIRPDRQPQVLQDRGALRQAVRQPGQARFVSGRPAATPAAEYQRAEHQPGTGQAEIIPPPPAPGRAEAARHERPVVSQHQQRCRDHHFLGRHPQQTGHHRYHQPRPRPRALHRANEPVERQQVTQPHQRFRPLHHVGHRGGLQRVQCPHQRHRQRQRQGRRAKPPVQRRPHQRPAHDTEQRQPGQEVDTQVDRVISPGR